MERQLSLNLASESERVSSVSAFLRPVELASRQVAAVALIVGCGELIQVAGTKAARWSASKEEIAEKARKYGLKCSANTFLRAVEELEARRVVGVLRNTRPWTYVVSMPALSALETVPADPLEALASLPCFHPTEKGDRGGFRSASVSVGQSARDRERQEIQNPCPTVYRERNTCPDGLTDRMRRPWDRQCGLRDDDLVWAVTTSSLDPVRRLWREAKVLEWVGVAGETSDDELLRFLTIVHHAATSTGINQSRMGVLTNRVKRQLDVSKIAQVSEKWAAGVVARQHALPAMSQS